MLMQFSMALHLEMKILNICELILSGRLHIIMMMNGSCEGAILTINWNFNIMALPGRMSKKVSGKLWIWIM